MHDAIYYMGYKNTSRLNPSLLTESTNLGIVVLGACLHNVLTYALSAIIYTLKTLATFELMNNFTAISYRCCDTFLPKSQITHWGLGW